MRSGGPSPGTRDQQSDTSTWVTGLLGGEEEGGWHNDTFWNRVKQAGPQLKTIRFEVSENIDPLSSRIDDLDPDNQVFSRIEGLVKYRFEQQWRGW